MNTKEKLELLWKYLFLLVVAIGVFRFTNGSHSANLHFGHGDDHDMLFVGDDKVFFDTDDHKMDVKVEKEIVDGDTLVKMWINGEEVNAEQHDMKDDRFNWKSKHGNVMVIDIDDSNSKNEKVKKIIKKKIIVQDKD